ncbi:hypothetical protein EG329_012814 [Mollisiaceae sp. DMI_Dod_QoI]|nr:hypothetical protein EG329_012814 [Helotiales sp. DMI_Dod_QoI]
MTEKAPDTMCDMCQKLTPDAIKASPRWGLPHYNSLELLLEGTSKLKCHLCSLIREAPQDYFLDKDFALRITQKPPLAIRVFATEHNVMGFACGVWNPNLNEWDRCDMGRFRGQRSISFIDKAAAAASDVHQGIFQETEAFKEYQDHTTSTQVECLTFAYVTPVSKQTHIHDITSEPLYKRAWALQERILSRRVVTYGTDRVTWQCRTHSYSESDSAPPETFSLLNPFELGFLDVFWSRLVTRYSQCGATYETDKLPALSGLVKTIKLSTGSTYLAGLWKETIFDNLLWKVRSPGLQRRSSSYRAPTWSWASLDGPIDLDFATYPGSYAELLEYDITAAGLDTTGEILGGWLEMRGALRPLISTSSRRVQEDRALQMLETNLFFDDVDTQMEHVFCFQLKYEGGLLLTYSGRDDRSYIRIGMFKLSEEYFARLGNDT